MYAATLYSCGASRRGRMWMERRELHVLRLRLGSSGLHGRLPADLLLWLQHTLRDTPVLWPIIRHSVLHSYVAFWFYALCVFMPQLVCIWVWQLLACQSVVFQSLKATVRERIVIRLRVNRRLWPLTKANIMWAYSMSGLVTTLDSQSKSSWVLQPASSFLHDGWADWSTHEANWQPTGPLKWTHSPQAVGSKLRLAGPCGLVGRFSWI